MSSTAVIQRIKAPELRGASLEVGQCTEREVCLDGPAGTGKTVGSLYKIHRLLSTYPGSRALVARKTNTALAGSAMVTYRDNIKRGRADIHWFGGNKIEPAAWKYANGSEMIVNGLDKPEKVQSAEFDWAYINEATECNLEDIEFVRMRLRPRTGGPAIPYRQLIMDCNPGPPNHWLNQRMISGVTKRLFSRHEDNPRYFDLKTNDWTEEGYEYVFGILEGLTGVRYARYRKGIWAASEGSVYEDTWDAAKIVVDSFDIPKEWPRYLAIDFGLKHPFVCLWAALDPDGRLIIYKQIYMTNRLVEDHAKTIRQVSQWGSANGDPLPRAIICDHQAGERATLERHLGLMTMLAQKNVEAGIQLVSSRFKVAADGKPRILIFRDSLVEVDRDLAARKHPTCLQDEPESYVWAKNAAGLKDEPVKENDHALDALRYLVAHFDLVPSDVSYSDRVY